MELEFEMEDAYTAEKDLISLYKIKKKQIPEEGRKILRNLEKERKEAKKVKMLSAPYGVGKNDKYGWFILGCGQGPFFIWAENK